MKKLLVLLVLLLSSLGASSQITFAELNNSKGEKTTLDLIFKEGKPYSFAISCNFKNSGLGEIQIKPSEMAKFREALTNMKFKFELWDTIAKRQQVKMLVKDMPIAFPKVEFQWGSPYFVANEAFTARWFLNDRTDFVICYANISAENNKNESTIATLHFYTPQDVQHLIDALDPEKLKEVLKDASREFLFK